MQLLLVVAVDEEPERWLSRCSSPIIPANEDSDEWRDVHFSDLNGGRTGSAYWENLALVRIAVALRFLGFDQKTMLGGIKRALSFD